MEFRANPGQRISTVLTVDQFSDMVRAGTVEPTALYREPWTQGEWRPVADLPLFHRLSPRRHPLGPRLLSKQRERQFYLERSRLYNDSSFIERALGIVPLEQFARESGASAAARLFITRSHRAECVASIAFRPGGLIASSVEAPTSLWEELGRPTRDLPPFNPIACVRRVVTLPEHTAPALMRSATTFSAALSECPSVAVFPDDEFVITSIDFDVGYRHRYFDGEHHPEVRWINPDERVHTTHHEVLLAYGTLLSQMTADAR